VIGKGKTAVYVLLVTVFSTLSGLLFGAWVNGANAWLIVGLVVAGIAVLAAGSAWINRRSTRRAASAEAA
jgi:uncharacterized protein